jgi:predicted DNA-binding WGR domain protein
MTIYRYLVKDRGIALEDLLEPDPKRSKIRYTVFEFDPATHQGKTQLQAFQDEADARTMHTLLLAGRLPREYVEYKGGERDGRIESRVLSVKRDDQQRKPYLLSIRRGPGERLPTGAVKPLQLAEHASIMLDEFEAAKMALGVLEAIRAFWAARYDKLRETRTRQPTPASRNPASRSVK